MGRRRSLLQNGRHGLFIGNLYKIIFYHKNFLNKEGRNEKKTYYIDRYRNYSCSDILRLRRSGRGRVRKKCAYRSEVNVFPVNDVTLDYSFGWLSNASPPEESVVDVYFINIETETCCYIKTITDYNTEKYTFLANRKDVIHFNHTEALTIPEELFVGKKGTIRLSLRTEERSFGWGGNVYYYRTGDTVFLSETYIK